MAQTVETSIKASEERITKKLGASEERIVGTVKKSFEDYDLKLNRLESVQRRHSADITELKAALDIK
jgi:chaperonin cofactor prefoldin